MGVKKYSGEVTNFLEWVANKFWEGLGRGQGPAKDKKYSGMANIQA